MVDVIVDLVPTNLTLQNIDVPNGVSNCYNALQTITVAGGGTYFTVQNGGSAIMIAGQKISYLYGTRVFPGGYLHGYITTSGQYCSSLPPSMVATATGEQNPAPQDGSLFRMYPNPTMSDFTIVLADPPGYAETVNVYVYGMHGEILLKDEMDGLSQKTFTLSGKASGLYFIRVVNGKEGLTKKLIKN
jgi:hypothetical protein